jgi:hypothetical protein
MQSISLEHSGGGGRDSVGKPPLVFLSGSFVSA